MKNKWERTRRAGLKPRAPFYFASFYSIFRFFQSLPLPAFGRVLLRASGPTPRYDCPVETMSSSSSSASGRIMQ